MKIHLETGQGRNIVRAYSAGEVTVNQQVYHSSLILLPQRIIGEWHPRRVEDLGEGDFQMMAELQPELAILGTGSRLRFPRPQLTRPLVDARIGLEVMDTAAACRTYNILMAEGRVVLAALLIEHAN
jgi:uncharacterized protein